MLYGYRDGDLRVAVDTGDDASCNVKVGVGETWTDAIEALEATPIQATGRDCGVEAALRWAHGAGWTSTGPDGLIRVA